MIYNPGKEGFLVDGLGEREKEESKLWLKELGGKGTFTKRKKKQVGEREN